MSYREILLEKIRQNRGKRGYRSQLANAAGCHSSYFSNVLKGLSHLTPDQASALCDFWELSRKESEYFITLVNYERAGTEGLRKKLRERLDEMIQAHTGVPKLEVRGANIDFQQAMHYFSNWFLSAIHVALDVPKYRTAKAIASRLALPQTLVEKSLLSLQEMGLVAHERGHWRAVQSNFYFQGSEDFISVYHAMLRNKANLTLNTTRVGNVHHSIVAAMSLDDYAHIRSSLLELIHASMNRAKVSESEELVGMCYDLFVL